MKSLCDIANGFFAHHQRSTVFQAIYWTRAMADLFTPSTLRAAS
jgi:hypothetical protein